MPPAAPSPHWRWSGSFSAAPGVSIASFGFVFCWAVLSFSLYGILVWRRNGILIMKDRLATVPSGPAPLLPWWPWLAVVFYVLVKGAPVVFASFPASLSATCRAERRVTSTGWVRRLSAPMEQVLVAALISVPIAFFTATYLVESRGVLVRLVRNVVDAMTGTPSIIAGLFIYSSGSSPRRERKERVHCCCHPFDHDASGHLPGRARGHPDRARVTPEAALAVGAPEWRVAMRVVLPAARAGLITAAVLGIARTAGETAEVLFTAGGGAHYNWNPFTATG